MGKKTHDPELPRIFTIRQQKVVLDSDLARLYGVQTKRLNEAATRNRARFPADFCFVLTKEEFGDLISQNAVSNPEGESVLRSQTATLDRDGGAALRLQPVTLKTGSRGQHRKYLPRVFTEHGALMAANVLRSDRAVQMSIYLVRAFVEMRDALLANTSILKRLAEIDRRLLAHDSVLSEIVDRLQPLLDAPAVDENGKPKIGYHQGNR